MRLVYGVGINDKKDYWDTKEYFLWNDMLRRCYSKSFHLRKPTYAECTVSENFKSFSFFYDWCQKQVGFKNEGWELDKDILIKGNKIYSEDTCVFVPSEINSILISCKRARGDMPVGVSYHKRVKKYQSRVRIGGGRLFLGYFDCPIKAFNRYKEEKENHIKSIALKYKNVIDHRAYTALSNYYVSLDD